MRGYVYQMERRGRCHLFFPLEYPSSTRMVMPSSSLRVLSFVSRDAQYESGGGHRLCRCFCTLWIKQRSVWIYMYIAHSQKRRWEQAGVTFEHNAGITLNITRSRFCFFFPPSRFSFVLSEHIGFSFASLLLSLISSKSNIPLISLFARCL